MSVVIHLSEQTYERLQKIATPFVDTPAVVVERLLDLYERQKTPEASLPIQNKETENMPDLTHTKIIKGQSDGRSAKKWNALLQESIRAAINKGATREELASLSLNIDLQPRSDSGYRYLSELGISLQGASASVAWNFACRLAGHYSFPLYVKFEWRMKSVAAHPGKIGELQFAKSSGVTFKFVD